MKAFHVKSLTFLLIVGLIAGNFVDERSSYIKNDNGNNGRTVVRNNIKKVGNDLVRLRRSVHYPYPPCLLHFFLNRQPPNGLRRNLNQIRYICQEVPTSDNTFYATMYDEALAIAVYSAYVVNFQYVNFGQVSGQPQWRLEPGIVNQANDGFYNTHVIPQGYNRGHLVPAHTFSTDQLRYLSTYTYTNIVPQGRIFNSGDWNRFEQRIRKYAEETCTQPPSDGELYLITGTSSVQIRDANQDANQVANRPTAVAQTLNRIGGLYIPNSLWTAGCCIDADGNVKSFAVMGNNVLGQRQTSTQQIFVTELQRFLTLGVTNRNVGGPTVELFPGKAGCANDNNNIQLPQLPQ